jgi:hypothetical protein
MYWFTIPSLIAQGNDACYGCNGSTNFSNVDNLFEKWNHVLINFNGQFLECYVNGILYFGATKIYDTKFSVFNVGRANPSHNSGEYFTGIIDDIRIYNRVLTQSEITYLATH